MAHGQEGEIGAEGGLVRLGAQKVDGGHLLLGFTADLLLILAAASSRKPSLKPR